MWCSTRWRAETAWLALLVSIALPCVGAYANTGTAVNEPRQAVTPTVQVGHPQLFGSRLQGQATLRYFGLRIYHARLWTLPDFRASQPVEQPLVLELEYLRNLKGNAIAERSLQEMRRIGSFTQAQGQRWLTEMQRIFPDVKAGDRLSGLHMPGQGARFWLNERAAGQVDDAQFSLLFFGIWLAPATSEPDMRTALLGQIDSGQQR